MPIRREDRHRYPPDWGTISLRIRSRAGYCCEECGAKHNELGARAPGGKWHKALPGNDDLKLTWPTPGDYAMCQGYDKPLRIIRIILTVAHLDHTPENNDEKNLKALCQRCHNRHDAPARRRRRRERGPQLDLFPMEPIEEERRKQSKGEQPPCQR